MAGTILHRCSVSAPGARTVAVTTLPPGRQSAGRARLWARACRCMKPVVNSSAAQDGGEDGSADRKPTRKKRTRPPRQSQQHGAVTLSLQDLAYGRPPWRLKKLAELNEMGLDRLLPSALLEMDPTEQGGNCAAEVEIRLRVEKVGAGFYVKGRASTDVALRCSVCASPYQCGVTEAPFQVWLSRNDSDVDQAGPDEVPWPSHLRVVDLTEAVSAAICDDILETHACADCLGSGAQEASGAASAQQNWGSSEEGTSSSAGGGMFGGLAKLKASLK